MVKKLTIKNSHTYKIVIAVFIFLCLLIGFFCFRYYIRLQNTVKAESGDYLQEVSKQIGVNVSKTIRSNFSVLGSISTALNSSDSNSYQDFSDVVRQQRNYWDYEDVFLVEANGVAHDINGVTIVFSGDNYLQEAIVNKKPSMSAAQVINGNECVVFAIPLEGITIEGKQFSALVASYDLDSFDKILSMSAFDGQGYAHVIRRDGTIIIRSSFKEAAETGYNILNSIAGASFKGEKKLDGVIADINNGKTGLAEYSMDGKDIYMAYTPIEQLDGYLLTMVPVSVVNAKSESMLKLTILLCGFIMLSFALLLTYLMFTTKLHRRRLERIAYVDPVTGGDTIQRFYQRVPELLEASNSPNYALVYTNIEKFKVLNEQFGRDACNKVLVAIERGIHENLGQHECIGRLFADNFCILMEYKDEESLAKRFDEFYASSARQNEMEGTVWLPLRISFGVYVIGNHPLQIPHMIDRAKLSLRDTSREQRGKLRYAIFDEKERHKLFREKQLEDIMEASLKKREFQVYLQPKYKTQDETVGGAEALVRWISPTEGMIFPNEFISLFEKNGFIIQIDLFVFEEVCSTIRKWLDAGREPIRISVNCSRVHLRTPGFLNEYKAILARYRIPPRYIEIELTETVVFEDVEQLTNIISEIHRAGFCCSMDDFGSGYSSLNLIQDIPVDVLKLDGIFFRGGERSMVRTEAVIGSIISMSRALSMETVAEGVEDRIHVDMLKRMGCDYIQGYYFAKPMPIADFELLLFGAEAE